jgi:hypothetical protein
LGEDGLSAINLGIAVMNHGSNPIILGGFRTETLEMLQGGRQELLASGGITHVP